MKEKKRRADVHVAAEAGGLEHHPRVVAPGAAEVDRARALDGRAVDDVPVRVVARAARRSDVPGANRLCAGIHSFTVRHRVALDSRSEARRPRPRRPRPDRAERDVDLR